VQARNAGVRLAARVNLWVVAVAVAVASALSALTAPVAVNPVVSGGS
jgi:hypothetical protein